MWRIESRPTASTTSATLVYRFGYIKTDIWQNYSDHINVVAMLLCYIPSKGCWLYNCRILVFYSKYQLFSKILIFINMEEWVD